MKHQWKIIDTHLKKRPITSLEAVLIYQITRLSEIVRQVELHTGKTVNRKWVNKNSKRYKLYFYDN